MYLVRKYTNFKRLHLKESPKETAEKELDHLNNKIEKLLVKLELGETEETASDYDECVICLSARVTIEVLPCGHKVVCRKCFIKTIQTAIVQRSLPLKCIVCRAKILKINNPDFEGGVGGGCHPSSSSKSRPKATARCRIDTTTMTSQPMKSTPVRVTKATGCYSNQSPSTVVATKLMQPLLIYPSRSSPVQQRAFFTPSITTTRTRATTNIVDVCVTPTLRTHHHQHHHHRLTTMTTTMEQTVAADSKRTTTTTTSRLQNLVGGLFLRGS